MQSRGSHIRRGATYGTIVGCGAGVVTNLIFAVAGFVYGLIFSRDEAFGFLGLFAVYGAIIGLVVGGAVGLVGGFLFGATLTERYAKWVTPVVLQIPLWVFANKVWFMWSFLLEAIVVGFGASVLALVGYRSGVAFNRGIEVSRETERRRLARNDTVSPDTSAT